MVTSVTTSQIEGTFNNGKFVFTRELNTIESPVFSRTGDRYLAFPLEVGKKWDFKYDQVNKTNPNTSRWQLDASVAAYEKVKVASGEFDAFKIEYKGSWSSNTSGRSGRVIGAFWYAPAARNVVKGEIDDGYESIVRELVEFQLQP